MGIGGVKHNFSEQDISNAIKNCRGVVSMIAKSLNLNRSYFYDLVDRDFPHLRDYIEQVRLECEEEDLDKAEQSVKELFMQIEDKSNKLKASMYYLNNRGKKRGYNLENDPSYSNKDAVGKLLTGIHNLQVAKEGNDKCSK